MVSLVFHYTQLDGLLRVVRELLFILYYLFANCQAISLLTATLLRVLLTSNIKVFIALKFYIWWPPRRAFVGGRGFRYSQKYEFSSRNNCFPSNTFNLNAFVCINGFQRYQLFFKQEPSGPKSQRHFRPCCKISL